MNAPPTIAALIARIALKESGPLQYLKIYDPYFTVADLDVLAGLDPTVQVYIVATWKAQKGITPGDRRVEDIYRSAWSSIIEAKEARWVQVTLVGTRSGESPVHNRYIITENGGLALGTSIGGLGIKDSDMHILEEAEARGIEAEFVDPLLGPQYRLYRGEQLIVRPFLL